jgi:hypothetical protein
MGRSWWCHAAIFLCHYHMRQVPPGQTAFGVVANAQPLQLPKVQRQSERETVCKANVGKRCKSAGCCKSLSVWETQHSMAGLQL